MVGAVVAATVLVTVPTPAVTGEALILGERNGSIKGTVLRTGGVRSLKIYSNSSAGTPLELVAQPGRPPMVVNSQTKVVDLNADLLDGLSSIDLQRRVDGFCPSGYSIRAIDGNGGVTCEQDTGVTDHGSLTGLDDNDHPEYVRESEFESVSSAMIKNGHVANVDLQDGATLAEILDDDGHGSTLDADKLDGTHAGDMVRYFGAASADLPEFASGVTSGDVLTAGFTAPTGGGYLSIVGGVELWLPGSSITTVRCTIEVDGTYVDGSSRTVGMDYNYGFTGVYNSCNTSIGAAVTSGYHDVALHVTYMGGQEVTFHDGSIGVVFIPFDGGGNRP